MNENMKTLEISKDSSTLSLEYKSFFSVEYYKFKKKAKQDKSIKKITMINKHRPQANQRLGNETKWERKVELKGRKENQRGGGWEC